MQKWRLAISFFVVLIIISGMFTVVADDSSTEMYSHNTNISLNEKKSQQKTLIPPSVNKAYLQLLKE